VAAVHGSGAGGGWAPGKPGDALSCPGAGDENGVRQMGKGSDTEGVPHSVGCSVSGVSSCQPRARASTEMVLQKSSLLEGKLFLWASAVSCRENARLGQ